VFDVRRTLHVEPLSAASFGAFGSVIDTASAREIYPINDGTSLRFNALATVDCASLEGVPIVSIFRAEPRARPLKIQQLERHPLGSQAFMPLGTAPYLIVVSESLSALPRAFLASCSQGINLFRGTWHHALLALEARSDFLVIDRIGAGDNCDEGELSNPVWID